MPYHCLFYDFLYWIKQFFHYRLKENNKIIRTSRHIFQNFNQVWFYVKSNDFWKLVGQWIRSEFLVLQTALITYLNSKASNFTSQRFAVHSDSHKPLAGYTSKIVTLISFVPSMSRAPLKWLFLIYYKSFRYPLVLLNCCNSNLVNFVYNFLPTWLSKLLSDWLKSKCSTFSKCSSHAAI